MRTAVDRTVLIAAPRQQVWRRIGTPEGINDELREQTLDTVPLGKPLGCSVFLLLRVLPIDYDRIVIAQREPEARFVEESTMASMRAWRHERTLVDLPDGGTALTDVVSFELRPHLARIPGRGSLLTRALGRLFAHRHHRIVRLLGAPGA
jgi:ligand-binding SRPBCC domain-containing protein